MFLINSGGQYEDGTTDITRTVAVGEPTAEMRDRFTRVLKGHIAIARAVFPEGTTGAQLDSFARQFLWAPGLDFDHGTGHGVGSYLSVHEGPARISKLGTTALKRGMILSNEPGYYKAGGLRHPHREPGAGGRRAGGRRAPRSRSTRSRRSPWRRSTGGWSWRSCSRPTRSPGSTAITRGWQQTLSPLVDAETRAWLAAATRPLGRH